MSCFFRISSQSSIWSHCSTWATCCEIRLGASNADLLVVTGNSYEGKFRCSNLCAVTVWYVGC